MADFLPNLWESIFTSGPTPTLLIATNVTFASLQLVLLLLLLATYSVHFVVLSTICGGLWWSINWFASEVAAVRAEEEAKAKKDKEREVSKEGGGESADDEGESTEVETEHEQVALEGRRGSLSLSGFEEGSGRSGAGKEEGEGPKVRQRNVKAQQQQQARSGDLSGEISTDSEWEKVEDGR